MKPTYMVMTNVEGEKMENINVTTTLKEEPKTNVKKKGRQIPKLKEGTPKQNEDMKKNRFIHLTCMRWRESKQSTEHRRPKP
jgi:hypothetical protein